MHVAPVFSCYGREAVMAKVPATAADLRQTASQIYPVCSIPDAERVMEYSLAARLTTQSVPWSGLLPQFTKCLPDSRSWYPNTPKAQFQTSLYSRGHGCSAFTRTGSFVRQKIGQSDSSTHCSGLVVMDRKEAPCNKMLENSELHSRWLHSLPFADPPRGILEERKIQISCGIKMFSLPSLPCPRLARDETAHHLTGFASDHSSHVTPVGCKEDPLPHNSETKSTDLSFEVKLKTFPHDSSSENGLDVQDRRKCSESEIAHLCASANLSPQVFSTLPDPYFKTKATSLLTKLPKAASTLKPLQTSSCTGPLKHPFARSADTPLTKDSARCHGKLKSKRRSETGDIPRNRKPGTSFRSGSLTRSTLNLSFRCGDLRKAFKCTQCRYLTDRKNNLKRHVITMHQASTRLLECCGALFPSKAALRDHVTLFHRGGYRCQVCGRNFCRKALLRRHLTVHSGQKDYACAICGYATSHKSNLERHQRVHGRRGVPGVRGQVSFSRLADKGKLNTARHAEDKEPTRKSLGAKHSPGAKAVVSLDCEDEAESKVTSGTELCPGSSENSSSLISSSSTMKTQERKEKNGMKENPEESLTEQKNVFCLGSECDKYCRGGTLRQFLLPNRLQETHKPRDSELVTRSSSAGDFVAVAGVTDYHSEACNLVTEDSKENKIPAKSSEYCAARGVYGTERKTSLVDLTQGQDTRSSQCEDHLTDGIVFKWEVGRVLAEGVQDSSEPDRAEAHVQRKNRRMCVHPYYCFLCSSSYSHQADFQCHLRACHVNTSELLHFPLSATVRKGCITALVASEPKPVVCSHPQ